MVAINEMIDLGSDKISEMNYVKLIADDNGDVVSFATYHIAPNGEQCGGLQPVGEDGWKLLELEPLTILPSINCNECPSHFTVKHGVLHDDTVPNKPCEICRERYDHLMPQSQVTD